MGLDQSGTKSRTRARTGVAASDVATPVGVAQAGSIASLALPGSLVHVQVSMTGGAGQSAVVTLFGYMADTDRWFAIAQLNGGGAIIATTGTPIAPAGSDVFYAETFSHIGAYDRLYPMITSVAGAGPVIDVDFVFET